jgi:hypothetical protein
VPTASKSKDDISPSKVEEKLSNVGQKGEKRKLLNARKSLKKNAYKNL